MWHDPSLVAPRAGWRGPGADPEFRGRAAWQSSCSLADAHSSMPIIAYPSLFVKQNYCRRGHAPPGEPRTGPGWVAQRGGATTKWLSAGGSDPSPGGAWPPPSHLREGGLISNLLPGEKVLRYEAVEGSFESELQPSTGSAKCLLRKEGIATLHCRMQLCGPQAKLKSGEPTTHRSLDRRQALPVRNCICPGAQWHLWRACPERVWGVTKPRPSSRGNYFYSRPFMLKVI